MNRKPYRFICTYKELSCIIPNLFYEILPVCNECNGIKNSLIIKGRIIGTGEIGVLEIKENEFNFYGDSNLIKEIRGKRCLV